MVIIFFLIFEGNKSAEKYGEKFEWKIHRFASILPKLGQPPLQHTCLPSPPLSLRLLQEFREQYHGYEAFLRLPLRDDFIKFALIISPSGNPPARGDEAGLFFFPFFEGNSTLEGLFPLSSPRGLRNGNTFTRFSALAFHLFPSCIFFFFLTIVIRVHRYSKSIQFFVRRDEKCFFKRRVETSSSRDSIIRFWGKIIFEVYWNMHSSIS